MARLKTLLLAALLVEQMIKQLGLLKIPGLLREQAGKTILPTVQKVSWRVKPLRKIIAGGSLGLGYLPSSIQAASLEFCLNHALSALVANGEFDFLLNRCCMIDVRDRNLGWLIGYDGVKLKVTQHQSADVTISAEVLTFLDLISQRVDPDTLFFRRKLSIEGDVEMGLQIKNMLDALDEDDLPAVWRKGLIGLKKLIAFETSPLVSIDKPAANN